MENSKQKKETMNDLIVRYLIIAVASVWVVGLGLWAIRYQDIKPVHAPEGIEQTNYDAEGYYAPGSAGYERGRSYYDKYGDYNGNTIIPASFEDLNNYRMHYFKRELTIVCICTFIIVFVGLFVRKRLLTEKDYSYLIEQKDK